MAGERKIENSEPNVQVLKPDISALKSDKDMASRKDGITSETNSLPSGGDGVPALKGDTVKKSDAQQAVYQPHNGGYNYYYQGYNGGFNQLDEQSYLASMGGSYGGMPDSPYYMPGYNPYNAGYMGTDAENAYLSPGYYQQHVSYGSEALQSPQWNSTYAGDKNHKPANKTDDVKSSFGLKDSVSAGNTNPSKTMNTSSTVPLNSKARKFTVSSEFAKSLAQSKPLKPLNRLGSGFPSMENINAYYPSGKFSGFNNANRGVYNYMHYGPQMNYHGNGGRVWSNNQRFKSRNNFRRDGENEGLNELTRGPRANIKYDQAKVSSDDKQPALTVQREKYNSEEFQTVYDSAKFFVIKSYSEDDIHKCVKYDVWSSTPNGNKKLDAVYREAETKASESGTKCPIFLFFSVNGSGQFLGVAEMTGQVDFNKTMDFWQMDKWSGFFPVKWHIVKDLPNNLLRQITLENNENKPVTFSRDTQEVGLKHGLEILEIFKKYSARTSLLDDFVFYENREKTLKAKRTSKPPPLVNDVFKKDAISGPNAGDGLNEVDSKTNNADVNPSLVNLTKDLSISSLPVESAV